MPERHDYPILYSFRRCPYAIRTRIIVRLCRVRCELREVVLRDKPPCLLDASPKGTVPVLICRDGTVIDESRLIMEWALNQHHPFSTEKLVDGWQTATRSLVDNNDGEFKHHLDRFKYPNRFDGADPRHHRIQADLFIETLNSLLSHRIWLMGDVPSLADVAIGPFIRQFANADREAFDTGPFTEVQRWLSAFLDWDAFTSVMQKYPKWTTGDPPTLF